MRTGTSYRSAPPKANTPNFAVEGGSALQISEKTTAFRYSHPRSLSRLWVPTYTHTPSQTASDGYETIHRSPGEMLTAVRSNVPNGKSNDYHLYRYRPLQPERPNFRLTGIYNENRLLKAFLQLDQYAACG